MRSLRYLRLLVFVCGACTLGLELAASNLLAPYFGTSRLIWANVIGLTLLYLTAGYTLGGRLADRRPELSLLCSIIAGAGLLIMLIPALARPILGWSLEAFVSVDVSVFLSSLIGVLILFSAPLILLGMVSPFAIRLSLDAVEGAGRTAGGLYALSTVGSILGTFIPTLLLTPLIGTSKTIYCFAAILLLIALPGLWSTRRSRALVATAGLLGALALIALPVGIIKPADCEQSGCELLHEQESAYNYIQIAQRKSGGDTNDVYLILNEGKAIHSIYRQSFAQSGDPRDLLTGGPWDYFGVSPYFYPGRSPESVDSLALIGSAAGSVPKQFLAIYGPETRIDGVEIDGAIVELGRKYFAMEDTDPRYPNYETHVQDGRVFIALAPDKYDVIGMDAYRQPYIPFHLTTREFFQTVRDHLTPDGVAVVNAGKPGSDYRLVEVLATTMKAVYPQVFMIDTPGNFNTILVGVNRPVGDGIANFRQNMERMPLPVLREIMESSLASNERKRPLREWTDELQIASQVFTDDWAPVESVIDQIILGQVDEALPK